MPHHLCLFQYGQQYFYRKQQATSSTFRKKIQWRDGSQCHLQLTSDIAGKSTATLHRSTIKILIQCKPRFEIEILIWRCWFSLLLGSEVLCGNRDKIAASISVRALDAPRLKVRLVLFKIPQKCGQFEAIFPVTRIAARRERKTFHSLSQIWFLWLYHFRYSFFRWWSAIFPKWYKPEAISTATSQTLLALKANEIWLRQATSLTLLSVGNV